MIVQIQHTFTLLPPLEGKISTPSHILLGLSGSPVASPAGLRSKGLTRRPVTLELPSNMGEQMCYFLFIWIASEYRTGFKN